MKSSVFLIAWLIVPVLYSCTTISLRQESEDIKINIECLGQVETLPPEFVKSHFQGIEDFNGLIALKVMNTGDKNVYIFSDTKSNYLPVEAFDYYFIDSIGKKILLGSSIHESTIKGKTLLAPNSVHYFFTGLYIFNHANYVELKISVLPDLRKGSQVRDIKFFVNNTCL